METISQAPQLSERLLGQRNAMQSAFDTIESLAQHGDTNEKKMVIATKLLQDMRMTSTSSGKETYRMEEALAKLVEYFQMEAEVENRKEEIVRILPDARIRLSANDTHFNEEKYKVN